MRAGSKGLSVLAFGLLALSAGAQSPDLTGRWTLLVENAGSSEGAAPPRIPATASTGWGREITITQEGGRLTIERHQFAENDMQPPMRYVFVLDGTESRHVVNMGRGPQEQIARAERKGEAVVIASRHAAGTALAAEVTHVFSIDHSGGLIVETTRPAGGVPSTVKARYRKQPLPSPTPSPR
jgi:hypothetical protein